MGVAVKMWNSAELFALPPTNLIWSQVRKGLRSHVADADIMVGPNEQCKPKNFSF